MAYGYYRTITIDHTKCGSSSSSSFPVLVSISSATSIKLVGSGGRVNNTCTQTGGVGGTIPADLVFSTDSAGASKLPWEVEYYDGAAGTLIAWVQVPTVSNSADTVIYMAYGDAGVTTQQNTGSYAPGNVWDTNFKGIWHLPNGTTLSAVDSTGANNGTLVNTPTAATGKIDGGAALDGASQYISAGTSGIPSGSAAVSISAWIYLTALPTTANLIVSFGPTSPVSNDSWILSVNNSAGTGYLGSSNYANDFLSGMAVSLNTWHHAYVTYAAGQNLSGVKLYLDGASQTGSGGVVPSVTVSKLWIGKFIDTAYAFNWKGNLDEVRISNVVRSADWITTEYNNQNAPGNIGTAGFLTFGAETANASGTTLYPGRLSLTVTGKVPVLAWALPVAKTTLALAGKIPALRLAIAVPKATLALAGKIPGLTWTLPVAKTALALAGKVPSLKFGLLVAVGKALLRVAGYPPTVSGPVVLPSTHRVFRNASPGTGDVFRSAPPISQGKVFR